MKKKGLIISTIVMVVVLVASLTTATYAWFTAESEAAVTDISFSVSSASDVLIGVSTTNAYAAGATNDNFVSNEGISYDTVTNTWSGGTSGLGYTINTGLDLSDMTKAVYTGVLTPPSVDSSWDDSHAVIKASGNNANVDTGTIAAAVANGNGLRRGEADAVMGDYLDICFGVTPAVGNLKGIQCVIGIKPTTGSTTLGMNAAITVRHSLDDASWTETDVYGNSHYNTVKSDMTAPAVIVSGTTWAPGDATLVIDLATAEGDAVLSRDNIYQLHIKLFISGIDSDCIDMALGVGATISIDFVATT